MGAATRRVVLGRVLGAHGLRGQLRVRFFGDGPENLMRVPEIFLGRDCDDPDALSYAVQRSRQGRPGEVRMTLEGVSGREAAEELRGRLVLGEPAHLEPLPEGEHYWFELIGCEVFGSDGRRLGTVREIWETGAHDVLVVEREQGEPLLVPTADPLLGEVDVGERRIVVELLPGLVNDDEEGL